VANLNSNELLFIVLLQPLIAIMSMLKLLLSLTFLIKMILIIDMSALINMIDQWFLVIAEKYGYFGIFFGSFADVLFPLVPSEIVLGVTGSYIAAGKLNFFVSLAFSLAGNLTAATIMWYLGKKYGHPILDKYGKYIGFTHDDLIKAENNFNKWGYAFVFFSQFIPLMRSLITAPAGILELEYKKYIVCIAAGSTIWSIFLITLGIQLRGNYHLISDMIKQFGYPVLALVIIAFGAILVKFYLSKNQKKISIN
jgi:membrane protein DedA with SNARE-associated domain